MVEVARHVHRVEACAGPSVCDGRAAAERLRAHAVEIVIEGLDDYQSIAPTESNGLTAPAMLARASTCSNTIYLPPYKDVDALEIGMNYSLMDGGFGLA